MQEDNGRFLRPKKQNSIRLTPDGMSVDGTTVIRKSLEKGTSQTNFEICERPEFGGGDPIRERLAKIARCLAEGRQAEAIFLATIAPWRLEQSGPGTEIAKANFNPAEPRNRGEWSKAGADSTSPHIEHVQYRGYFHDFMLNDLLQSLTSHGAVAIKNVQVFGISGTLANTRRSSATPEVSETVFHRNENGFRCRIYAKSTRGLSDDLFGRARGIVRSAYPRTWFGSRRAIAAHEYNDCSHIWARLANNF